MEVYDLLIHPLIPGSPLLGDKDNTFVFIREIQHIHVVHAVRLCVLIIVYSRYGKINNFVYLAKLSPKHTYCKHRHEQTLAH